MIVFVCAGCDRVTVAVVKDIEGDHPMIEEEELGAQYGYKEMLQYF